MKKILYLGISINGNIADNCDQVSWSNGLRNEYAKNIKAAGCLIIGRKTYDLMEKAGEFEIIGNPRTIVISSGTIKKDERYTVCSHPTQALFILKNEGYSKVFIGGGSQINSLFLDNKLVDEILLDIEPFIYGEGVPLFQQSKNHYRLKLLSTKKIDESSIQLHYEILYNEIVNFL